MTDKVQKIREEVERLKSQLLRGACSYQITMETCCKEEAYDKVLAILDTMQEEPASEELEEAAIEYSGKESHPFNNAFKAGANWQKEKDAKLIINVKEDGYRLGLATMKQQMMAKAVDGVITFDYYGDDDKTYGCIAHDSFCLEDFGLKDTDKVKMILIKED